MLANYADPLKRPGNAENEAGTLPFTCVANAYVLLGHSRHRYLGSVLQKLDRFLVKFFRIAGTGGLLF